MAYQLKTTGIAASVSMLIAVDEDGTTVKDFANLATVSKGANVTTGTQAWDGNTRAYFEPPASRTTAADFVSFTAGKPVIPWSGVSGKEFTLVFIGAADSVGETIRAFGLSSANSLRSDNSVNSTGPTLRKASSVYSGTSSWPGNNQKLIFGFNIKLNTSTAAFHAQDDAGAMTKTTGLGVINRVDGSDWTLDYVGRDNDSTTTGRQKTHAIIMFDDLLLSDAEWDSLRDDWFGTLLETASGGSAVGAASHYYRQLQG